MDEEDIGFLSKKNREEVFDEDESFFIKIKEKKLAAGFSDMPSVHQAILEENFKRTKQLIENKSNVNKQDEYLETPLHVAVRHGNERIVSLLIQAHANVNVPNKKGWTPLFLAVRRANKKMVSLLLNANADVNAPANDGFTPLLWAADLGHTSIVKMLLEAGADKEGVDQKGRTALMRAVRNGYTETVFALLMRGVKVDAQDIHGKSAMDYAEERGCNEISKLLRLIEKREKTETALALTEQTDFADVSKKEVLKDEKGRLFVVMTQETDPKKQVYQLVSNENQVLMKPVAVKKSTLKGAGFKAFLLKDLINQRE